jgi:hypothetical protein
MRKYTHVKIVQENVDRAVGFIEALVVTNGVPVDYARTQAKTYYQLSAVESAIAMERYHEVILVKEGGETEDYMPKPLSTPSTEKAEDSVKPDVAGKVEKEPVKAKAAK